MAVADHKIVEMRERRVQLHAEYAGIVEKAAAESRGFSAEENERMAKISADMDGLKSTIQAEERSRAWDKELSALPEASTLPGEGNGGTPAAQKAQAEMRGAFNEWLREGATTHKGAYAEARGRFVSTLAPEQRGLTAANPTQAGYLFAPEQFMSDIIKGLDNELPLRTRVRRFQLNGALSMGNPKRTARAGRMTKGTEISTAPENTNVTFGKKELKPQPYSDKILLSRTLMRHAPNVDAILREEIVYSGATTQEYEYLNGSGNGGPLGVFTASNDGISTGRDVSTDNTSTAMTYKGLVNAKMSLKQGYRKNANWLFHRDGVAQVMKILDGQNLPIFLPSTTIGELDRVLNVPVLESEDAPNTFTTGLYVGVIGDFSWYWVAESLGLEINVANELYLATNQIGYFYRMEFDGQPVLEEAFARVKLG